MVNPREEKQNSPAGDQVGGDKITVGDITNSAVAIGEGARATVIIQEAAKQAVWVGVPPLPPRFVGRDQLLQELLDQLIGGAGQALALEGLPGVGKSTLAVALVHHPRIQEQFKDGVLWAGLGPQAREEDVAGIFNRWANALGIDVAGMVKLADRKEAIADAIGQKSLLIVVDDAWAYDLAKELRFGNLNLRHLLTTRDQEIAARFVGVGGTAVSLPTLQNDPAFQLLQTLAPEATAADPQAVKTLAQTAGGLPLALELLGGYLALPRHKLRPKLSRKALEELMDPQRRLQLAQERLGGSSRQETLQEAITLSIEGLRELENGADLEQAFYALGAFAPKPESFTWEAAEAVTGIEIEELVIRNLVEMSGEDLAIHQVMADVARTKTKEAAISRHREFYLEQVNTDRQDWQHIESIYGQVRRAWEAVPENEEMLELIWALHIYFNRRGLWQEGLAWSQRGLELSRINQWRNHEGTLLNNMGMYFHDLGQPQKALQYYNQALPILEEEESPARLAITLNNIAEIYKYLNQPQKALEHFNQALAIQIDIGDQEGLGVTYNNIGASFYKLGQWEKALEYYNQALAVQEKISDRYGMAATLNNMGAILNSQGRQEEALAHYKQALSIREEVGDRVGLAVTLSNIGLVYDHLGRQEEALAYYYQSLPIQEKIGDRSGQATTLFNLALIMRDQNRLPQALDLLKQVVEIERQIQDPNLESDSALLAQVEQELAARQEEE